jgi:hypothetical protein
MSYSIDGPLSNANKGGYLTTLLTRRNTLKSALRREHTRSCINQQRIEELEDKLTKAEATLLQAQGTRKKD